MQNYILLDLETKNPGNVMLFPDDTSAIRAVKTALRKPESVYAQFPDKFQLVSLGRLQFDTENTPYSHYYYTDNRSISANLTSFMEDK